MSENNIVQARQPKFEGTEELSTDKILSESNSSMKNRKDKLFQK